MADDKNKEDENFMEEDAPKVEDATDEEQLSATDDDVSSKKKKMEDDAEDFDLDKEIESLDEFLMESEEDEDLNLDDEEHVLTASNFKKNKNSGGAGKFIGYAVFVVLLCALLYGGVVYGPKLVQNSEFDNFEQSLANRTVDMEKMTNDNSSTDVAAANTMNDPIIETPIEENVPTPPSEEELMDIKPLPVAADEEVVNVEENDVVVIDEVPAVAVNDAEEPIESPATTIADALALTQSASQDENLVIEEETVEAVNVPTEEFSASEVSDEEEVVTLEQEVAQLSETIDEMTEATSEDGFERTRAVSMAEGREATDESLPPLEEEKIQIANDVMQMPEQEITEVVEAVDDVVAETEELADDVNTTVEAEEAMVENAAEDAVELAVESETEVTKDEIVESVTEETEQAIETAVDETEVIDEEEVSEIEITLDTVESSQEQSEQVSSAKEESPTTDAQEETKVAEVKQVKAAPKVSKPAPVIKKQPEDPRVSQAQEAYKAGDYSNALAFYDAVLQDDPSNTRALTGRQMAKAKMRVQPETIITSDDKFPVVVSSAPRTQYPEMADKTVFEGTVVSTTAESMALREKLRQAEAGQMQARSALNAATVNNVPTANVLPREEDVLLPQPEEVVPAVEATSITREDIVFYDASSPEMPMMEVESKTVIAPADGGSSVPAPQPVEPSLAQEETELQAMMREADTNPRNAALAVSIGDQLKAQGDIQGAVDWYKTALKRDALYKTGLDRMSVYDRLAGVK